MTASAVQNPDEPQRGYGTDKGAGGETLAESERLPDGTIRYSVVRVGDDSDEIAVLAGVGTDRVADAEFIAAARSDVPLLVAGVRSLQARITELEAVIAEAPHGQKCDWWHAIPCDCWKSRYRAGTDQ